MYGHGAAPPPRSAATVISLRVLFAAAGFLTCGLLACVPLFRVAVLRGKWFDWTVAWLSLPLAFGGLAVVGSLPESDHRTDFALAGVLLLGALSAAYFMVVDIRHHRQPPPFPGYIPAQPPPVAYGYPQPQPYPATQIAQPPAPHTPIPVPQPQPQQPQRPAPARIDQVRAELDELSDYLRKHEGHPEDGR